MGYISKGGFYAAWGGRRKYLGRVKIQSSPFTCPMCRESEDSEHFMGYCEELKVLKWNFFFYLFTKQNKTKGLTLFSRLVIE